jgi:hypothetical protein
MALINIALLRGVHLLRFVECYEVCSCFKLSVSLQQQLPGEYSLRSLHCGLEEFIPASQICSSRFFSILHFKNIEMLRFFYSNIAFLKHIKMLKFLSILHF